MPNNADAAAHRVLIQADPFAALNANRSWLTRGVWPFHWITVPGVAEKPVVLAFRRHFVLDAPAPVRLHVSADETYALFLDGRPIGRGPERSAPTDWRYDTYDLVLSGGPHVLAARVAALGPAGPRAQISLGHGFLLAPQDGDEDWAARIGTGVAPWEGCCLPGYAFFPPFAHDFYSIGHNVVVDGGLYPWGWETGDDDGADWSEAVVLHPGSDVAQRTRYPATTHLLRPAALPPLREERWKALRVRAVTPVPADEHNDAYRANDNLANERAAWEQLLSGDDVVVLPPGTTRRVLIDLGDYVCAHVALTLKGGGQVRVHWAESLFEQPEARTKGNRSAAWGKHFVGVGDTFQAAGGERSARFETLLWRAGRYVEVRAQADAAEPLVISELALIETRYPLGPMQATFASDDAALDALLPSCWRTLQCCSHDTLTDGPYYEQMMWLDDAVQQAASLLAGTREADPLLRQALWLFDQSRLPGGLTRARYPARDTLVIPAFSLHLVGLTHQHALWRGDADLVRALLPGLRAVLDACAARLEPDGVMRAALEAWQNEPELAARAERQASALAERASQVFWNEARGAFAADRSQAHFSEHAQILAVLSGALDGPGNRLRRARVRALLAGAGEEQEPPLARVTLAFAHYLFEACRALDLGAVVFDRLRSDWFPLTGRGLFTTPEKPEPSRSDCHGWSAHPVFHLLATLLGIRPGGFGFDTVVIAPLAASPLTHLRGAVPHPGGGEIAVDLHFGVNNALQARISLPPQTTGQLRWQNQSRALTPGEQNVALLE